MKFSYPPKARTILPVLTIVGPVSGVTLLEMSLYWVRALATPWKSS